MVKWKLREVETSQREKDYECEVCGTPAALTEGELPDGKVVNVCPECLFKYCTHETDHVFG